jgi:mannose-1-phosphate guanylyltransferase
VIPSIGYVDLKEQALPLIARKHRVQVIPRARPLALPLRTRADYIRALRWYHRSPRVEPTTDPFEEDWRPVFALCEQGADVDPSARLHDSVVLAGGRVERGAMVVRSVVCAGGVVERNQTVVDRVVTAAGD